MLQLFSSSFWHPAVVLRSLNAITQESAVVAVILGRPTPDPGFGAPVELFGGNAGGLLDLRGVGEALSSQGITPEEAPPAFLEVEPSLPRSG
jgi:hypothetical protein